MADAENQRAVGRLSRQRPAHRTSPPGTLKKHLLAQTELTVLRVGRDELLRYRRSSPWRRNQWPGRSQHAAPWCAGRADLDAEQERSRQGVGPCGGRIPERPQGFAADGLKRWWLFLLLRRCMLRLLPGGFCPFVVIRFRPDCFLFVVGRAAGLILHKHDGTSYAVLALRDGQRV